MSTTLTVYGSTNDGHFYAGTDGHFSLARDAASANEISAAGTTMRLGLAYPVPPTWDPPFPGYKYGFYRLALYFDTSAIPSAATIVSAALFLYLVGNLDIIPVGFEAVLAKMKDNDETYPHDPLAVGDFDRTLYVTGGASSPTIYDGSSGFLGFTFNSTGQASWINKDGTSKFLVMSSLDIGYSLPNLYMLADFYTREQGTSYAPKLIVTYATPCTVTTGAATGVTSSGATGHGQVTDSGGESVTGYGVIWNNDGSDPVDKASADNYAVGSDIDGSGNFTAAITGCASGTAYYYRSYATTIVGTSVGSAVQFTTSSVSALTVTTDEPADVLDTTATLNGTIVDDGGYSITQHGFIYKLGGDPGEPADPTTAEAYTEEGAGSEGAFDSAVSGLTEDSTYYARAYAQTTDDGGHLVYGGVVVMYTGHEVTETFYGHAGDGLISRDELSLVSYAAAHEAAYNASTGESIDTASTSITVGHQHNMVGAYYKCYVARGYVYFDTSSIPANSAIISSVFSLFVTSEYSSSWVACYNGQPSHPTSSGTTPALELNDYDIYEYTDTGDGHQCSKPGGSGWSPNQYFTFCDNPDIITPGGLTKLMLDMVGDAATNAMSFTTGNAASNKPKLVVTYIVRAEPPIAPKANLGDTWKDAELVLVNMGDEWVAPEETKINIGDSWVDPQ